MGLTFRAPGHRVCEIRSLAIAFDTGAIRRQIAEPVLEEAFSARVKRGMQTTAEEPVAFA